MIARKSIELCVAEQTIQLLPQCAAYWPERATLLVADIHLGRSAAFRERALFLPPEAEASDLDRLAKLVEQTKAERLIILGDLFHARAGMTDDTRERFGQWLEALPCKVYLVEGNHDRRARRYSPDWMLSIHAEPIMEAPFVFAHEPMTASAGYVMCGHLHPGIRQRDAAGCSFRAKAFWRTPDYLVLPAFSSLASMGAIKPQPGESLYACADGAVFAV